MTEPRVTTSVGDVPEALLAAFSAYELALAAGDLDALSAAFVDAPTTIRSDRAGVLVGHDAIDRFRGARGAIRPRRIAALHVRMLGDDRAVVVSENEPDAGGHGLVTQQWALGADGRWRIAVAQVAATPPAIDRSVWRVVGDPLVTGAGDGPLAGETVAVKDLFAVAGHAVGGGVPAFLAEQAPAGAHSAPVAALLAAGADVVGIARTDEFAYSIAGQNPHYGTPPNPRHPGHLPGGSSSGPASAVALGQASIGLATDTGGSIRIPSSYQGLWGLRTTHDAVPHDGVLPLAPSFDTVGWITRDAGLLERVATAMLPEPAPASARLVVAPALLELCDPEVRSAFEAFAADAGAVEAIELPDPTACFTAFRLRQAAEAWDVHGAWIREHPGALGEAVAARFAFAATIDEAQRAANDVRLAALRSALDDALGDATLLLPAAPTPAPPVDASPSDVDAVRTRTLTMTSVVGLTGRPAVAAPLLRVGRGPVGVCAVGGRGSDAALVGLAAGLAG